MKHKLPKHLIQNADPFRGEDVEGQGGSPPQIVRWKGRRCFYPPQYLENVLQVSTVKNEREEETVADIHALPSYYYY